MLPTAIAPIYAALPMCPTIVTSTSPNSGTVMFDTIDGMAIFSMSLSFSLISLDSIVCAKVHIIFGKTKKYCL